MLYSEFDPRAMFFAVIAASQRDLVVLVYDFEDLGRFGHANAVALTQIQVDTNAKSFRGREVSCDS